MVQIYSQDVTVGENSLIPLNIVTVKKGATVTNSGSYELVFNQCGVYKVDVSAVVTNDTAGSDVTATMILVKNGVEVPYATSSTGPIAQSAAAAMSFSTLVQIDKNNSPCVCSSPIVCSIENTGSEVTYNNILVIVTKIA